MCILAFDLLRRVQEQRNLAACVRNSVAEDGCLLAYELATHVHQTGRVKSRSLAAIRRILRFACRFLGS